MRLKMDKPNYIDSTNYLKYSKLEHVVLIFFSFSI